MQPFDIFNAEFAWHGCLDMRPWLVIELRPNGRVGCFPLASDSYSSSCFPLDILDVDFAATGLKKSCYIHDSHIFDIPLTSFRKQRGVLTGELLKQFREYAGV